MKACEPIQREAEHLDVHITDVAGWPEWRQQARRLEKAGRAILADENTYGAYLDAVAAGKPRARLAVDQLHDRIEDRRVETTKAEHPEPRRKPDSKREEGFAYILDDPEKLQELREQIKKRERKSGARQTRGRGRSM